MESSWEEALTQLAAGVAELEERERLAGIVRGEVEQLERIADRRGEKLKTIVEATAASAPARPREVVVFPSPTTFKLHVAPYDVAWFHDRFAGPPEPTRFLLRPLPNERLDLAGGRPATCTIVDPDGDAEPWDWRVSLRLQSARYEGDVLVAVFERVGAAHIVGFPAPATQPLEEPISASRVCEAIAAGRLRVEAHRKPDGIVVTFADVP